MFGQLDIWQLIGGIGLFMFAMSQLETALRAFAGSAFKRMIRRSTDHPVKAVLTGTVTTAALQSSSLVGLMVLAFVGSGLMALENALGVIFGANIGTTVTGWLVTFLGFKLDLARAALPMVGIGGLVLVSTSGRMSEAGRFVVAAGFLLMGLDLMKESVETLSTQFDIEQLRGFAAWQYLLFGIAITAIIQSSSATMMIVLTALHAGIIDLEAGAAIAIGADLGTISTIVIGALPGIPAAKRVALAHVIFNVLVNAIAFAALTPLLAFIAWLNITDPMFALVAFHSLFNVLGVLLFMPFFGVMAAYLNKRFVRKQTPESRFIHEASPEVADAAIVAIEKETAHLIARVAQQNMRAFEPPLPAPPGKLPIRLDEPLELHGRFEDIYRGSKRLEGQILAFAVRLQMQPLEEHESVRLDQLLSAVRHALNSAKPLRDIRHNLTEFEESGRREVQKFLEHVRSVAGTFYGSLYGLPLDADLSDDFDEFTALMRRANDLHDGLYREVIEDISNNEIDENEISSLLNVNRELLHSNLAIITSLRHYRGTLHPAMTEAPVPAAT